MKINKWWKKVSSIQKSGLIFAIISALFFTIFLLDIFYTISTKIPPSLEFIFIPTIPILYLGIYGCSWSFWGDSSNNGFFGSLCDSPLLQILLFFLIYTTIGYLVGISIGYVIEKIKKK